VAGGEDRAQARRLRLVATTPTSCAGAFRIEGVSGPAEGKVRVSDTPNFRRVRPSRARTHAREAAPSASSRSADVAQRLKYGARQIEALEAEEFRTGCRRDFVRGWCAVTRSCSKSTRAHLGSLRPVLRSGEVSLEPARQARSLSPGRQARRQPRLPVPLARGDRRRRGLALRVAGGRLSLGAQPRIERDAAQPQPRSPARSGEEPRRRPRSGRAGCSGGRKPAAVAAAPRRLRPSPRRRNAPGAGGEGKIRMEFAGESWVEIKGKGRAEC